MEPRQLGCEDVVISIDVVEELDGYVEEVLFVEELEYKEEVVDRVNIDVSLSLKSLISSLRGRARYDADTTVEKVSIA
jgi:hypothetical protein